MKYAGIDIGTTTISAVLIDGSGREFCHYTVPNDSALHGKTAGNGFRMRNELRRFVRT